MNQNLFLDPREHFADCLDPGEKLLWAGQPRQGIYLSPHDGCVIPFFLVWGGVPTAALINGIIHDGWHWKMLMAAPFVLIGAFGLIGRHWFDAWWRAGSFYALTPNRLIIRSTRFIKRVQSFDIKTLDNLAVKEKPNGWGSVQIGPPYYGQGNMQTFYTGSLREIADARKVFNLIRQAQQAAKADGGAAPQ